MFRSISFSLLSRSIGRRAFTTKQVSTRLRSLATFPAPRLFDYETIVNNLSVTDAIDSVEEAFGSLAKGKVEVPMPM